MVTARRPGPASKLPPAECAIAAANIRVLRQRNGWSQAYLGELMGWPAPLHRVRRRRPPRRTAASRHPGTPAWPQPGLVFQSGPGSVRGSPNLGITLAPKPVTAMMRSSAIVTTSSP